MFSDKYKELISGLLTLAIGIFYLVMSFQIPVKSERTWSSAAFPKGYGIAICVVGVILCMLGLIQIRHDHSEKDEAKKEIKQIIRVLGSFGIFVAVIAVIDVFGFAVSAALYMFLHFLMLGKTDRKSVLIYLVLSVAISTIIYLIFVKGFGLMLPSGSFFS